MKLLHKHHIRVANTRNHIVIRIVQITYKRDTESLKNSIAPKIVNDLSENVSFSAYDPLVKSFEVSKKVVLLGDPSVGKTSVARKFVYDMFDDKYISTLGTKISKKQIVYENLFNEPRIELTLLVWDVMGQHDYAKFHEVVFTGCKGALIV